MRSDITVAFAAARGARSRTRNLGGGTGEFNVGGEAALIRYIRTLPSSRGIHHSGDGGTRAWNSGVAQPKADGGAGLFGLG